MVFLVSPRAPKVRNGEYLVLPACTSRVATEQESRGPRECKRRAREQNKQTHKTQKQTQEAGQKRRRNDTHCKKSRLFRPLWLMCSFALKPFSTSAQCLSGILGRLFSCFVTLLPSDRCMLPAQDNHHYALWACEGTPERPRG